MRAIVDAKYKRLVDVRFPNADAYQMLAYCTALTLDRGFLVYAADAGEKSRTHRVRNSTVSVEVRSLELEAPPDAVLRQVDLLAEEIAGGGGLSTSDLRSLAVT